MSEEVARQLEAYREREKRKFNVVVFGLEEGGSKDKVKISRLFHALGVGPISLSRYYRLGKKVEGSKISRPLLVTLGSVYEKRVVLNAVHDLMFVKGYESIFVRADRTKEKRAEFRFKRENSNVLGKPGNPPVGHPDPVVVDPAPARVDLLDFSAVSSVPGPSPVSAAKVE